MPGAMLECGFASVKEMGNLPRNKMVVADKHEWDVIWDRQQRLQPIGDPRPGLPE